MVFCPDASALLPFLLPEEPPAEAIGEFWSTLWRRGDRLVAPPLLFAEITSVLRRYVHTGTILHEEAVSALTQLFQLRLSVVNDPDLYLRALELSRQLGQPKAYDVQYLAVAEYQGCPVVTLDRDLYESARTLGIAARLLA